jgi:hypothetical protein
VTLTRGHGMHMADNFGVPSPFKLKAGGQNKIAHVYGRRMHHKSPEKTHPVSRDSIGFVCCIAAQY